MEAIGGQGRGDRRPRCWSSLMMVRKAPPSVPLLGLERLQGRGLWMGRGCFGRLWKSLA